MNGLKKRRGTSLLEMALIVAMVGIFMSGCAMLEGLQVQTGPAEKAAMVKEGGYLLAKVAIKTDSFDQETQSWICVGIQEDILPDLKNVELAIEASWLKERTYDLIEGLLERAGNSIDPDVAHVIRQTQNMFYFEGGGEATPDERLLAIGFFEGILEGFGRVVPMSRTPFSYH